MTNRNNPPHEYHMDGQEYRDTIERHEEWGMRTTREDIAAMLGIDDTSREAIKAEIERLRRDDMKYNPDYAVPPGATLGEIIDHMRVSKSVFANRAGMTEQVIDGIVSGEYPITLTIANALDKATGVPSSMWMNLESQWRCDRHRGASNPK